jgi:hypothetical protein
MITIEECFDNVMTSTPRLILTTLYVDSRKLYVLVGRKALLRRYFSVNYTGDNISIIWV